MPVNPDQKKRLQALGLRIRTLREERGLTLKDLAFKIDKEPQSIHRLEVGGINPSFLYLQDLCGGLNITLAALMEPL